jgi:hypothetical protein
VAKGSFIPGYGAYTDMVDRTVLIAQHSTGSYPESSYPFLRRPIGWKSSITTILDIGDLPDPVPANAYYNARPDDCWGKQTHCGTITDGSFRPKLVIDNQAWGSYVLAHIPCTVPPLVDPPIVLVPIEPSKELGKPSYHGHGPMASPVITGALLGPLRTPDPPAPGSTADAKLARPTNIPGGTLSGASRGDDHGRDQWKNPWRVTDHVSGGSGSLWKWLFSDYRREDTAKGYVTSPKGYDSCSVDGCPRDKPGIQVDWRLPIYTRLGGSINPDNAASSRTKSNGNIDRGDSNAFHDDKNEQRRPGRESWQGENAEPINNDENKVPGDGKSGGDGSDLQGSSNEILEVGSTVQRATGNKAKVSGAQGFKVPSRKNCFQLVIPSVILVRLLS